MFSATFDTDTDVTVRLITEPSGRRLSVASIEDKDGVVTFRNADGDPVAVYKTENLVGWELG